MIAEVTKKFDAELTKVFKQKPDILRFLLKHERKDRCILNLCAEISRAEQYRINVSVENYSKIIKDFARMFARAALTYAEEKALSDAERARRIWESDRLNRAEQFAEDLEKETLNANKDEDWAREIKARREAEQVQERILSDAGGSHESGTKL